MSKKIVLKSEERKNVKSKSILQNNWLTFTTPTNFAVLEESENEVIFEISSMERGFGITLGNALRRTMLSSLHGIAIAAVEIEGVDHEYSSIDGVKEDMMEVAANLRSIVFSGESADPHVFSLSASGPCAVTADMIEVSDGVEVVNKDSVICHLNADGKISMKLHVISGKGYVQAKEHALSDMPFGTIFLDAFFSPVLQVSYDVKKARIGSDTEFDKLLLKVKTNGALEPDIALAIAAKILQEQLKVFVTFSDAAPVEEVKSETLPFDKILLTKIENIELSVRSQNCLKNENIIYVGDLVKQSEVKMLQTPNFGKKSLNEIKDWLSTVGLRFNMDVPGWDSANIVDLAKKYDSENSGI